MTVFAVIMDNEVKEIFANKEDAEQYNKDHYGYFTHPGFCGNSWSMVKEFTVKEEYKK